MWVFLQQLHCTYYESNVVRYIFLFVFLCVEVAILIKKSQVAALKPAGNHTESFFFRFAKNVFSIVKK